MPYINTNGVNTSILLITRVDDLNFEDSVSLLYSDKNTCLPSLKIPPKLISKEPYIFERKINLQCTLFVTQWQDDRLLKNPKAFLTIWAITTSQKIGVWSLNTFARLPPPFKKVLLYLNGRSTGYFIKHLLFQVAKYSF